jgi:hypothetical protein
MDDPRNRTISMWDSFVSAGDTRVRGADDSRSDDHKLRGMGIPRRLFRLTSAFEAFKGVEEYPGQFFEENMSKVKFVDEPEMMHDDEEALIPAPKSPYDIIGNGQLKRRWTYSIPHEVTISSQSQVSVVPSTTGLFRKFTSTFLPTTIEIEEPNEHTFEDHFRMSCAELDEEDALEPLHDEMMLRKMWLLLELIPMKRVWQERGRWRSTMWYVRLSFFTGFESDSCWLQAQFWTIATYAGSSSAKYPSYCPHPNCEVGI